MIYSHRRLRNYRHGNYSFDQKTDCVQINILISVLMANYSFNYSIFNPHQTWEKPNYYYFQKMGISSFKRVFHCLVPPLSEQQRASFQGCRLYSLSPRRERPRGPLTGHTLDPSAATGRSSGFQLGQSLSRLELKGQLHLWDKLLIFFALSEREEERSSTPPPASEGHSRQS